MQLGRHDVEHPMRAVARATPSLLADEGERICLVEQPELPDGHLAIPRITEDASAEQVAMKVGDERSNVAHAQRLPISLEAAILAHQRLRRLVPIGFV